MRTRLRVYFPCYQGKYQGISVKMVSLRAENAETRGEINHMMHSRRISEQGIRFAAQRTIPPEQAILSLAELPTIVEHGHLQARPG